MIGRITPDRLLTLENCLARRAVAGLVGVGSGVRQPAVCARGELKGSHEVVEVGGTGGRLTLRQAGRGVLVGALELTGGLRLVRGELDASQPAARAKPLATQARHHRHELLPVAGHGSERRRPFPP